MRKVGGLRVVQDVPEGILNERDEAGLKSAMAYVKILFILLFDMRFANIGKQTKVAVLQIMKPTLEYMQPGVFHSINQTMLIRNPSAPETRIVSF